MAAVMQAVCESKHLYYYYFFNGIVNLLEPNAPQSKLVALVPMLSCP